MQVITALPFHKVCLHNLGIVTAVTLIVTEITLHQTLQVVLEVMPVVMDLDRSPTLNIPLTLY